LHETPGVSLKQCDAADLSFAKKSFDWFFANHMLYHLDDPDHALKESTKVLRADVHLIVALQWT
jgi:ubiquinone/menaquinone biosynthesis C-methylase UbiE